MISESARTLHNLISSNDSLGGLLRPSWQEASSNSTAPATWVLWFNGYKILVSESNSTTKKKNVGVYIMMFLAGASEPSWNIIA